MPAALTLSVPEAGAVLGISRDHAYVLARHGQFPVRVLTIGSRKRVSLTDLERYLDGSQADDDAPDAA